MIRQLPFAVSGIALSFLRILDMEDLKELPWDVVKEMFEKRFLSVSLEVTYRLQLRNLTQNKGEAINSFIERIKNIASNFKQRMTDSDLKVTFLRDFFLCSNNNLFL